MDPLGKVLLANGALSDDLLADVLEQQRRTMPIGSMCYILGILDEEILAHALCKQFGMPSVVLERTIIPIDALSAVPRDIAYRHNILPLFEDEQRIFMATEDPRGVSEILREIRFVRGKIPVLHIALQVTLARTIRACYNARETGERIYVGARVNQSARARTDGRGQMFVISAPNTAAPRTLAPPVVEDVTKEIGHLELPEFGEVEDDVANTVENRAYHPPHPGAGRRGALETGMTQTNVLAADASETGVTDVLTAPDGLQADHRQIATVDEPIRESRLPGIPRPSGADASMDGPTGIPSMQTIPPLASVPRMAPRSIIDLDSGGRVSRRAPGDGPGHVLIVDDDFATRHLLVKVLQPAGIQTATAATGGEAIRELRANPPDVIILDVMLPEMDGFQICQAIKQSKKYNHIGVLLMSAVISSKRVTDDILKRYGAEGYYEKPIDTDAIKERVTELLSASGRGAPVTADDSFERALAMYKNGYLDRAIEILRDGLEVDPLSPKHHFVLANLLQKKSLLYEAIEEYEATVELKPDYFPALTRLAYLYYKKGFSAKAARVWKRSLQYCNDDALRQNIEEFIDNLHAEMTAID